MATKQHSRKRIKQKLERQGNDFCPLCMRKFSSSVTRTLEHIPPQSLGGKIVCYTCADCNNGLGSQIEAHFPDYHRRELDTVLKRHGQIIGNAKFPHDDIGLRTKPKRVAWMGNDALDTWDRAEARYPNREQAYRAYAKYAYLAIGCATDGRIWRENWTVPIRNYILNGGEIPAELRIAQDRQLGRQGFLMWLEPYIGTEVEPACIAWCWSIGWDHLSVSLIPFPELGSPQRLHLVRVHSEGREIPCFGDVEDGWYMKTYTSCQGRVHPYPELRQVKPQPILDEIGVTYQKCRELTAKITELYRAIRARS